MTKEIDEQGYLTTGECVQDFIKRKVKEDPKLQEIANLGEPLWKNTNELNI